MALGSYCVDIKSLELERDDLNPDSIVSGEPQMFSRVLSTSYNGNVVRGVWKLTEGTVTDVEEDEMFTVIEGRATVVIESGATIELAPGCTGEFKRGDKTTWTVHEPILKTFQITLYDDE